MAKLFLIALLFASPNLIGQTLDGFMGITFGSSIDVVKNTMLAKPGSKIVTEKCDTNYLYFKGIIFGGRETLFISFKFFKNMFYSASVFIYPAFEQKLTDLYMDIKKDLEQKYYKTNIDYSKTFLTKWEFLNTKAKTEIFNTIRLDIQDGAVVLLKYQDGLLVLPVLEAQKKKLLNDY